MNTKNCLVIIPARGGSKGIPKKNIKSLNGKPLIYYTLDVACQITDKENICVSTDDEEIIQTVEEYGLAVPFVRPEELSTDTATTNNVLLHAIRFYREKGIEYNTIILLQPTSPLRTVKMVEEALLLYNKDIDMVVSVCPSHSAGVLCKENKNGFLESPFNQAGQRRQDIQDFYEYNGAIYIINVSSLEMKGLSGFDRKIKYIMPEEKSIDIDTMLDWKLAELLMSKQ